MSRDFHGKRTWKNLHKIIEKNSISRVRDAHTNRRTLRILSGEGQKRNSSQNIIVKALNSQNKMYTKGYDKDHVI